MWIYVGIIFLLWLCVKLYPTILWLAKVYQIWVAVKVFAPVEPHWLLGMLPIFKGPSEEGFLQFLQWTRENPKCFAFLIPFRPSLVLCHPETIKKILKTSEPKCVLPASGGDGYSSTKPWIGDGLLNSKGKKWFRNRKLLTPGFHFDVLKPYVKVYNDSIGRTLDVISDLSTGGQSVEIYQQVTLCTLDIILKCAFSYKGDVLSNEASYAQGVLHMGKLVMDRVFNPLYVSDFIYGLSPSGRKFYRLCKESHDFADSLICSRKELLKKEGDVRGRYVDFLDILLLARDDDGSGLSDVEIRDEVDTFLFEGHDTTASAISWLLYNLATHRDVQQRAYEEIHDILNDRQELMWDDLQKLQFLTMCIKESMRLHSTVSNVTRELTSPMTFEGHQLPVGTPVDINFTCLHHNPVVWGEDVEEFKPERFRFENTSVMDSFAYVPFSAGPRNCIGQHFAMNEIKVAVSRMLQRFELRVDESCKVERMADLVLRPRNGIKLFFEKRMEG